MHNVVILPALGDNYIYLYRYDGQRVFVVDPGDAGVVLENLQKHALDLTHVLITHSHGDHSAGAKKLKAETGATIFSPDSSAIRETDCDITDGQTLALPGSPVVVIGTPGHTSSAVCYYVPAGLDRPQPLLFTGDTMFIGGCGRIIGATARDFFDSLCRLKKLPDETLVFPGHDYTVENYEFALQVEPGSKVHEKRLAELRKISKQADMVPSSIGREKRENLFMQAGSAEEFAELRRKKDIFG
ncbi:Hydroxyacylglutathione hydrolase [Anaerohalosphaera lusitana]|uniref:Hydroxyacylglutathione hydrolase n=1 Tax=Anaerohalosphaera lusitana TaxID=1936003 RepID=A0A1U9NHL2_9BACT|nr:hydroxyacylglutathione hydrolase [Anaerohalosphaera lusitana]AQT67411.1 Hydroxyacylglutathione hydrolase [Anaerohalosphaera lusitana]